MFALISYDKVPPGQFWYQDPQRVKPFQSTPLIGSLIQRVADFRAGNGYERAKDQEVLEDIVAFTCARLNNNQQWCYDTKKTAQQVFTPAPKGCRGCGAKIA